MGQATKKQMCNEKRNYIIKQAGLAECYQPIQAHPGHQDPFFGFDLIWLNDILISQLILFLWQCQVVHTDSNW